MFSLFLKIIANSASVTMAVAGSGAESGITAADGMTAAGFILAASVEVELVASPSSVR